MTYEPLNINCLFLSRELITRLKLFESVIHDPPWHDLQKSHVKIGNFYLIKYFCQIKTKAIHRDLLTLLQVKQSVFQNITVLLPRMYEKKCKKLALLETL